MERGFVPLWRKTEDSAVFRNAELFRLWSLLLIRATHKPYVTSVPTGIGNTDVSLQPGDVLFGRFEFAKRLRCPPGSIPKRIQKLISLGNITVKSNTHYSVITIVNWVSYADVLNQRKQPRKQAGNKQETHTNTINTEEQEQGQGQRGTGKRFRPPSLDEVSQYCKERGNNINPQLFIDRNTAGGWRVGKNPMKDWKAAIRTWEQQPWNKTIPDGPSPEKKAELERCVYGNCEKKGVVTMNNAKYCREHLGVV